ncbi:MAG: FkbM family methyltransferase [Rhodocyclaceae bacterium]|nr:FkbM family methyltransferase [Rhodocyclaceae bacterium]
MEVLEVEATAIDEYFGAEYTKIDIIKIDAEGSEPLIFDGMKKTINSNPDVAIICEFSPPLISGSRDPGKFLNELKDYGFIIRVIDENSRLIEISEKKLLKVENCELYLKR